MSETNATEIYVYLIGEGTDVWRPVRSIHVRDDVYRIFSPELSSDDEVWQFKSGELVRCREKLFDGTKKCLVAFERVSEED